MRASLRQDHTSVANRMQKILEDANIKLAAVASDWLGVSGRAILSRLLDGEEDAEKLAQLCRGRLREKVAEMQLALEGRVTQHHRWLLTLLRNQLEFLEKQIADLDIKIQDCMCQYQKALDLCITVPGIEAVAAANIIAEIGVNMEQFPSAQHLASWAGLCPGNNESAGKRLSGKARNGCVWVRRSLCQAAWAASHSKNTCLSAQFRRLAARKGKKRAIVAVAHDHPHHPLPHAEEPTTLPGSRGRLLRPEKCRATQALPNTQARAPRPSGHRSEPRLLGNPNPLRDIFEEDPNLRSKRNHAILALLIGCGLRRGELLALTVDSIQLREEHWVIADLHGKAGHIRTVPIPLWVKEAIDCWTQAGGVKEGCLFRAINKSRPIWGHDMRPKVLWEIVKKAAEAAGIDKLAPHDLRRTCARLCHLAGGELDQIQFLLGHPSIQTTEHYLGCKQKLRVAVNDKLGIEP